MPIVNFTIPDSSPWISYAGSWGDSDVATEFYTNGTFHFTNEADASASFAFNGTAVYLYGALRGNHDEYTVTVDGKNTTGNSHTDSNPGIFNTSLFASGPLASGLHTVTLSNTPKESGYVDLDWVVITVGDGNTQTLSNDFWLDDSSGNFTYDAGWAPAQNTLSAQYLNSTFIATNKPDAKATLTFYGNAVALYGATSSNHGGYTVALDSGEAKVYNGSQVVFRPQNLLYYAGGLPSGQHMLEVTNQGTTYTDLDYAIVSVWDSTTPLPGAVSAGPSSTTSSTRVTTSTASRSPTSLGYAPSSSTVTTSERRTSFVTLSAGTRSPTAGTSASDINPTSTPSAALSTTFGASKSTVLALGLTLALSLFSFISLD